MRARKSRNRLLPVILILLLIAAAAGAVLFFLPRSKTVSGPGLEVRFIDVGQGDCSLVLCSGEAMLIDGGEAKMSDRVYSYLRSNGIDHLKYIVATHPDSDHCGGLSGALSYAGCDYGLANVEKAEGCAFTSFLKLLDKRRAPLLVPRAGEVFSLGDALVEILGPIEYTDNDNNNSLVLRIKYGSTAFLFMGDAEYDEEQSLLSSGRELSATVLKTAHHGSRYSTYGDFLKAVGPEYAIISCGAGNSYGHPAPELLERLQQFNAGVYRTDLQGTITAHSDGRTVTITTEKNPGASVFESAPELIENTPLPAEESIPAGPGENEIHYILNTNTKRIHFDYCKSAAETKEKNKADYYGDIALLIEQGYKPCGVCMKNG